MADQIEQNYVNSLGLHGQSAAAAVETMLAEGFRCRIDSAEAFVPGEDAMWYCLKRPSGHSPPCDELRVALRFAPPANAAKTRAALLTDLPAIKVRSVRASCPGRRAVSPAYLAARGVAEASLAAEIEGLEVNAGGNNAYEKLLRSGFYCGFLARESNVGAPFMECSKLPSDIRFCYEAKVLIELKWADGAGGDLKHLYKNLATSQVTRWSSSCELPAVRTGATPNT